MDDLPILSLARMVRESARGIALRDDGRAVGVAFKSDGSIFGSDCIVRFDIADSEDPARRLADAFAALGARSIWFYGGDHAARRAASDLNLAFAPTGAAFIHHAESKIDRRDVVLRPSSALDRISINEIAKEYGRGFATPEVLLAQRGGEVVGVVMSEPLDGHWTEVRAFVYPAQRGRGHGAAILAKRADQLEAGGRLVCAATETPEGRDRSALERAGFRLADYYFQAKRSSRENGPATRV